MNDLQSKPTGKRGWLIFIVVMAVLAGGVWWVVHKQNASMGKGFKGKFDPSDRPVPVLTATVATRDVNVFLHALGTVTSKNTVVVKSRVDGLLEKVLFKEGQMVKAGQVLAQLDAKPFQVALEQAQAQLMKDKSLLENAKRDASRYQDLLAKNSIAKQTADTQFALVKQYEATVAADQAQVDNARINLGYCRIVAPISGRVGLRAVDAGNMVHQSDANGIVSIVQLEPITAVFSIPEDKLPQVQAAMKGNAKVPVNALDKAQNTTLSKGYLLTTDNQIDSATGTIKAKAEFANTDQALFPNQFVNVDVLVDVAKNALVVPVAAIQQGREGDFVYIAQPDNTVKLANVTTGPQDDEVVTITKGLEAGQVVVVDGSGKLKDGSKIKVVNAAKSRG